MTSLFLTVIAIILSASVLIATFTWMNPFALSEGQKGVLMAQKMAVFIESSNNFWVVRGRYPLTAGEMTSEMTLPDLTSLGGFWRVDSNIGCIGMIDNANNRSMMAIAQARLPGAVISTYCGTNTAGGTVFLAISLDGVATP